MIPTKPDIQKAVEKQDDVALLAYGLQLLRAYLSGEIGEYAGEEEIGKITDECLYDFPKVYTNTQILAFQKGVDKMWSKIKSHALLHKIPAPSEIGRVMSREEILGALARGYCSKRNSNKILDPDLVGDMATEIIEAQKIGG